jgi:DNA-directed RNA polymerase subunit RPC12/RpoP
MMITQKRQLLVLLCGLLQFFIALTLCVLLFVLTTEYGLPNWVHVVNLSLAVVSTCLLVVSMYGTSSYVCCECSEKFNPTFKDWSTSIKNSAKATRRVTCPKCKKRQWSKHTAFIKEKADDKKN